MLSPKRHLARVADGRLDFLTLRAENQSLCSCARTQPSCFEMGRGSRSSAISRRRFRRSICHRANEPWHPSALNASWGRLAPADEHRRAKERKMLPIELLHSRHGILIYHLPAARRLIKFGE
jgi:hypothetical protein